MGGMHRLVRPWVGFTLWIGLNDAWTTPPPRSKRPLHSLYARRPKLPESLLVDVAVVARADEDWMREYLDEYEIPEDLELYRPPEVLDDDDDDEMDDDKEESSTETWATLLQQASEAANDPASNTVPASTIVDDPIDDATLFVKPTTTAVDDLADEHEESTPLVDAAAAPRANSLMESSSLQKEEYTVNHGEEAVEERDLAPVVTTANVLAPESTTIRTQQQDPPAETPQEPGVGMAEETMTSENQPEKDFLTAEVTYFEPVLSTSSDSMIGSKETKDKVEANTVVKTSSATVARADSDVEPTDLATSDPTSESQDVAEKAQVNLIVDESSVPVGSVESPSTGLDEPARPESVAPQAVRTESAADSIPETQDLEDEWKANPLADESSTTTVSLEPPSADLDEPKTPLAPAVESLHLAANATQTNSPNTVVQIRKGQTWTTLCSVQTLVGLGYDDTAELTQLDPLALKLLVDQGLRRPRGSLPQRWMQRSDASARVRIEEEAVQVQVTNDAKSDSTKLNDDPKSETTPLEKEPVQPPASNLDQDKGPRKPLKSTASRSRMTTPPDPSSEDIEPVYQRVNGSRERPSSTSSRSSTVPAYEERDNTRHSRRSVPSPRSVPTNAPTNRTRADKQAFREHRRRERSQSRTPPAPAPSRGDDPPPFRTPLPDMNTFRSLLRNEASLRLWLLGQGSADAVQQEMDWRLGLYRDWLWLVYDGIGDPPVQSRSDRERIRQREERKRQERKQREERKRREVRPRREPRQRR